MGSKWFSKLGIALAGIAMAVGVGVGLGQKNNYKEAMAVDTAITITSTSTSSGGVTVTAATNTGSNDPVYGASYGVRLYANNTLTISCSANITAISFDWTKNSNKAFASVSASVGTYSHPEAAGTGTWSGTAKSIVFTVGETGQIQVKTLSVTHDAVSLVYATDISIDQNTSSMALGGLVELSATLTPASPTDPSISWSSSNTDILQVSSSGKVTAVNEGTATITANANGAEVANSVKDTLQITSSADNTYNYCDIINPSLAGVSSGTSTYTAWTSTKTATNTSHSTAAFNGKTNYTSAAAGIGFRSNSGDGIIVSTSAGLAKKIVVVWGSGNTNARTLNIHGSNSALTLSSMGNTTEQITFNTDDLRADTLLNDGNGYKYIAINASNTMYVKSLIVYWDTVAEESIELSGNTSAVLGDTIQYVATRSNSEATIDWYVDDVKQNAGITVDGDSSTFSFTPSSSKQYVVKALLNGTEVNATKNLLVVDKKKFALVSSIDELYDGVEIILAGTKSEKMYVAKNYVDGTNLGAVQARVEDGKIIKTAETGSFILNQTQNGYTIKDGSNYLVATGGTNNNQLKAESLGENSYWNISFSADNLIKNTKVASESNTFRGYIRFNSGSALFNCYASASQDAVSIYRLVESTKTIAFAQNFITSNGESAQHTCADTITHWDSFDDLFDALSAGEKALYANATHNAPETYTDANAYTIEHAVARYDHAIRTHEELRTNEFMGRFGEGKINGQLSVVITDNFVIENNNNLMLAIIITASVSTLAVGGYFFIRRKHQ